MIKGLMIFIFIGYINPIKQNFESEKNMIKTSEVLKQTEQYNQKYEPFLGIDLIRHNNTYSITIISIKDKQKLIKVNYDFDRLSYEVSNFKETPIFNQGSPKDLIISADEALYIAEEKISGYEYDYYGDIIVKYSDGFYFVNLADKGNIDPPQLGPDYDLRILIDAKSSTVVEVLAN